MSPARKKTKAAAKKTTRKKATRKTAAKGSAKAPTRKKAAAKKAAPPKERAKPEPAPPPAEPAKKTGRRAPTVGRRARPKSRSATTAVAPARAVSAAPEPPASRLGTKYVCFSCGAKFYDLNRPEPICPKCGADQRQRPKTSGRSKPSAEARNPSAPKPIPMAPLLDDDEVERENEPEREGDGPIDLDPELDLGISSMDDDFLGESSEETPEAEEEDT